MPSADIAASGSGTVDGRVLRGERTRASIVESLLGLLAEGEIRPTTRQIAERAGVSVRSIFQHFDDLEGLYGDLVRVQAARVQPLVDALRGEGDLEARVAALAQQRAQLFEATTPMRHAVGTRAHQSPTLARRIKDLSDELFQQVCVQFAPELAGEHRSELARAVDVLCSFESWDRLRGYHGLDVSEAEATLRRSLTALLEQR